MGKQLGRWAVAALAVWALGACGASEADGGGPKSAASDPSASGAATGTPDPSASPDPSPTGAASIPGDGTWIVGTDIEPGVYVGEGGVECEYQRLENPEAEFPQVIVRGLLDRPVIEIMASDGGFRSEGCGSWSPIEGYSGAQGTEMPGDGIWLVGEDVVPGTYRAEGGEWCLWQRLDAFAPELDSVITGGSDKRATIEDGDLAFVTEGCGAWTKVG